MSPSEYEAIKVNLWFGCDLFAIPSVILMFNRLFTCAHSCLVPQSSLTLCNPMVCSLPGSFANGIFFSKEEYWPVLPGDLPNPGIKPVSPASLALQMDSLPAEPLYFLTWRQKLDLGWRLPNRVSYRYNAKLWQTISTAGRVLNKFRVCGKFSFHHFG